MKKLNPVHIMQEEWDYLIVLDACRYDYFEKLWEEYLPKGQLTCRQSVGSATKEWRNKSFTEYYEDVVYISSNPFINSIKPFPDFTGKDHFFKIINVWLDYWQANLGTVCPENVTQQALMTINQSSSKRFIMHYLQPHAPYLAFGSDCPGFPQPNRDSPILFGTDKRSKKSSFREQLFLKLRPRLEKYKIGASWYLAQLLRLEPLSPMDAVRRNHGKKGLQRAYEENLRIVLKEINQFVRYISGKIIITSDHGEFLGEQSTYSHFPGSKKTILKNIPWFILEKESAEDIPQTIFDRMKDDNEANKNTTIEDRLKALGYL